MADFDISKWIAPEMIATIKQLAALQFLPEEIGIMLDMNELERNWFIECCQYSIVSTIYNAYHGGKLEEQIKIRQAIFLAAKQGSPPAQNTAAKLILENSLKLRGR